MELLRNFTLLFDDDHDHNITVLMDYDGDMIDSENRNMQIAFFCLMGVPIILALTLWILLCVIKKLTSHNRLAESRAQERSLWIEMDRAMTV